jgi:hypothetical protein
VFYARKAVDFKRLARLLHSFFVRRRRLRRRRITTTLTTNTAASDNLVGHGKLFE